MEKAQCYRLGVISKTQGYKGTLILHLDVDLPDSYNNMESVYVFKNNKLIPFFFEKISILPKGFARAKFEDIDTEEDALSLVKCELFLPLENLPELKDDQFYYHEIIGFNVSDEYLGDIGNIKDIIDIPGNPQLIVNHHNKEIFIPISDSFYRGIDKKKRIILVSLPDGLVDVNL